MPLLKKMSTFLLRFTVEIIIFISIYCGHIISSHYIASALVNIVVRSLSTYLQFTTHTQEIGWKGDRRERETGERKKGEKKREERKRREEERGKSYLLMLLPSLRRSPTAPVFWARSLPARSTRLSLLTFSPDTCNTQTTSKRHIRNAVHETQTRFPKHWCPTQLIQKTTGIFFPPTCYILLLPTLETKADISITSAKNANQICVFTRNKVWHFKMIAFVSAIYFTCCTRIAKRPYQNQMRSTLQVVVNATCMHNSPKSSRDSDNKMLQRGCKVDNPVLKFNTRVISLCPVIQLHVSDVHCQTY